MFYKLQQQTNLLNTQKNRKSISRRKAIYKTYPFHCWEWESVRSSICCPFSSTSSHNLYLLCVCVAICAFLFCCLTTTTTPSALYMSSRRKSTGLIWHLRKSLYTRSTKKMKTISWYYKWSESVILNYLKMPSTPYDLVQDDQDLRVPLHAEQAFFNGITFQAKVSWYYFSIFTCLNIVRIENKCFMWCYIHMCIYLRIFWDIKSHNLLKMFYKKQDWKTSLYVIYKLTFNRIHKFNSALF